MPGVDVAGVTGIAVAALAGMAIGLERQWSGHADGASARFGGIRTFTLLGTVAGVAGWLATSGQQAAGAVLLAGAVALIALGYRAASVRDVDATTEAAALVVVAAGALAGGGRLALASGLAAATALLLLEKSRVHTLVRRIDDASLGASVRFAAMACIVLPLLPRGPFGPFDAIRPRELWAFVLFFSGLSFIGWIARRAVGPQSGVILSGILGGLVSSTSVTTALAHQSRSRTAAAGAAGGAAAVAACSVMLVRVAVAAAVLNPPLALTLPPYLVPSLVIGVMVVVAAGRRARPVALEIQDESPLQLAAALKMAGLFQLVLFVILWVAARWSAEALVGTSVVIGLTDVDALTLSLARSPSTAAALDATGEALAAGVLANTLLKAVIAAAVGRGAFRLITVVTLAAMGAAMLAAIVVR